MQGIIELVDSVMYKREFNIFVDDLDAPLKPLWTDCECESETCKGVAHVCTGLNLAAYIVASFRQILCIPCAKAARQYCEANHYDFKEL